MSAPSSRRRAAVSCHVERPLDDAVWARFTTLQRARPGGFRIATLLRPPDERAGESVDLWGTRARAAAEHGPLGHHTHWTSPTHARPTSAGAGAQVLDEAARLADLGVAPSVFCGGGWYTDEDVAEACAQLGYVDCTPRARRPAYLAPGERWAALGEPGSVRLPSGRAVLALPTTHALGDLARELPRPSLPSFVHVYFHDTDLVAGRRRHTLAVLLEALALRAEPTDLDALARELRGRAPETPWAAVARGSPEAGA